MKYEEEDMEETIEVDNERDNEEVEVQSVEVLYVILLNKLTQVTQGKGLAEHIQDLKELPSGKEAYTKEISHPHKIVEHIFSCIELGGRHVEVL